MENRWFVGYWRSPGRKPLPLYVKLVVASLMLIRSGSVTIRPDLPRSKFTPASQRSLLVAVWLEVPDALVIAGAAMCGLEPQFVLLDRARDDKVDIVDSKRLVDRAQALRLQVVAEIVALQRVGCAGGEKGGAERVASILGNLVRD